MIIYVARHGETEWNAEGIICGRTDVSLSEKGIAQARKLAQKAKEKDISIIISSPMKRAFMTSQIVSEACGIPVVTDERLVEQCYGIYEGTDRRGERFLANKRMFAFKYPGGESMMQVAARVYPFLDEIQERYAGKNVLVVCHGGVCRVIKTYFEDMTNDEYFHYTPDNCEMVEYHI